VTEETAALATYTNGTKRSRVHMSEIPHPKLNLPLDYNEICKILPHRYPFLLVDRIIELEPGKRCVGIKSVTANEEFFQGHFPGRPVMPGVLILESMAQVAGVLTLVSRNTPRALSYFAAIEHARFRRPVQPGDTLVTEAELLVLRGALCKVNVVCRVDGEVAVEASYTFMTADDESSAAIARRTGQEKVVRDKERITAPRDSITETFIHPTALVDSHCILEHPVWIGPYCVIEDSTKIGAGTILESHVTIKKGTSIGRNCRVMSNSILGHEPQDKKFDGEESYVRIGDNNVLREMVSIHRATGEGEATEIGNNNMLMAYVHVGHNCKIGNDNLISNSTGISGHVTIEDRTVIGGFVGIHQFVHVGRMAMVGGLSKVVQDVPPFCICDGRPAKIHGLNTRGLRRNNISSEHRTEINTAFKLLYRSDYNTTQAIEKIRETIPSSPILDELLQFIERAREGRLGRQDDAPHL
jgi:UDP-N-acetylglucosamine acyltransferase